MRTPILGPGTFSAGAGSVHRENIVGVFKNGEVSSTLAIGQPVVLALNGTDDGLAVVLPATAGAAKTTGLGIGVVVAPNGIAAGQLGDVQVYGLCLNVKLTAVTRTGTGTVWASYVSGAIGDILEIETVSNGFTDVGSSASQQYIPYAIAALSWASSTTQASTIVSPSANTGKAFLRML